MKREKSSRSKPICTSEPQKLNLEKKKNGKQIYKIRNEAKKEKAKRS